jgi:hypothetical protein
MKIKLVVKMSAFSVTELLQETFDANPLSEISKLIKFSLFIFF